MKGFDLDDMRQARKYDLEEEPLTFDEILLQESPHVEKPFPWQMHRIGNYWMITKIRTIPDLGKNTSLVKFEIFTEQGNNKLKPTYPYDFRSYGDSTSR